MNEPWISFPLSFNLGDWEIQAHPFFEFLAFLSAIIIQQFFKKPLSKPHFQGWTFLGALVGALIGAKVLVWLEQLPILLNSNQGLQSWLAGKTILGALIGGWAGVEIIKKIYGTKESSSDGLTFALIVAIAIGRIGCFLTGLDDMTYGVYTDLPWGVDFGDGLRHPTQLYEIIFLISLLILFMIARKNHYLIGQGELFRAFMVAYLGWRFLIDFIKPHTWTILGLSPIQLTAFFMIFFVAKSWFKCHQINIHNRLIS